MTTTATKPRVLVLFGGQSPEHAVSCVTAAGVLQALDAENYEAVPVGITRDGQWTDPVIDPRTYTFADDTFPEVLPRDESLQLVRQDGVGVLMALDSHGSGRNLGAVDVVLPLLHGPFGEDGTLQGMLELHGLPYVGAGVLASAAGMDKQFMKIAFEAAGLRVGPYRTIMARQWEKDPAPCRREIQSLTVPLFVKPARGGSSVGITRVDDWSQFDEAVRTAREYDPKVIVEEGIDGREIECAVIDGLGGERARASYCGEIVVSGESSAHQFYDFAAKYTDGAAAELSCPADLPEHAAAAIREQAVLGFEALGVEGLCRSDFFYCESGEIFINEVNTMPGFTPVSMYPQMWNATGLPYSALIDELLQLALERPTGLR